MVTSIVLAETGERKLQRPGLSQEYNLIWASSVS